MGCRNSKKKDLIKVGHEKELQMLQNAKGTSTEEREEMVMLRKRAAGGGNTWAGTSTEED